ncbi:MULTISPECIES: ATP-binding cassette domain-containing protein [unclassified Micromonospora]|uniref:ATP-binding cassette domain-containing protein n=1 Tax=unclassified Micromonospora TaxID=2617518 RepID=UPI0022C4A6C5|nr:ATP-binding cassette domain-containing protein [Micromonospora sp. AKA38]GHJ12010.1 ABC transporter ATP-binding protein [Micromonospora sp. AKA38]GHJ12747.1 ABC transporter ATP-binding protein [Micromonospora sp. AKA38]GHJ18122.1 ABC transporter ATP-binding protein [Micromonospora sp. AKA38]
MSAPDDTGTPLLDIRDVDVVYRGAGWRRPSFHALHAVSMRVGAGETVGLVGESGSGKTTLGRAVLGLAPITGGTVTFDGVDITRANRRARRALSRDIQVVFQDPYSSLNPAMTVETILAEPLRAQGVARAEATARIGELLRQIGLEADAGRRYPREFSGGQRQRIAIARALALKPRLIVCDEPVSALDLSTQARILDLLIDVQEKTGVAYLFISHDLSVVRYVCHRVAVMLKGRIVETGDGDVVTSRPEHPYTNRLLMASPIPDPVRQAERRRRYAAL